MLFTSFKGRAFSLYFVAPVDKLSLVKTAFSDTLQHLQFKPRNDSVLVPNQFDPANRAALAVERLSPGSVRLRDVVVTIPAEQWEILKEEQSRGIPSVDLAFKASEGLLKATIQVLPAVVQEDSYLDVIARSMRTTNETMKSGPISTRIFSGRKFRCRHNQMTLKESLPFTIETCVTSTHLKSVMLILGGSSNLYQANAKEYDQLLNGIEFGE